MRKTAKFALVLLAVFFVLTNAARATLPVFDAAAHVQLISTVTNTARQVAQYATQIAQFGQMIGLNSKFLQQIGQGSREVSSGFGGVVPTVLGSLDAMNTHANRDLSAPFASSDSYGPNLFDMKTISNGGVTGAFQDYQTDAAGRLIPVPSDPKSGSGLDLGTLKSAAELAATLFRNGPHSGVNYRDSLFRSLGQSGALVGAYPRFFGVDRDFKPAEAQFSSITGAQNWAMTTYLPTARLAQIQGRPGATSGPVVSAYDAQQRRFVELENATFALEGASLQGATASAHAIERVTQLNDLARNADNVSKLLAAQTQALIAVTEELQGIRSLIAADARLRAAQALVQISPTGAAPSTEAIAITKP